MQPNIRCLITVPEERSEDWRPQRLSLAETELVNDHLAPFHTLMFIGKALARTSTVCVTIDGLDGAAAKKIRCFNTNRSRPFERSAH
jgi:hypothetical protein